MAKLFIIVGPSGCGKTSLVKNLVKKIDKLNVSISCTTRVPRANEKDGVNYFFITKDEFIKIKNQNEFIEYAKVFGNYYGSNRKHVEDMLVKGNDVILEIDWQGARQIKQRFAKAISIFILPPSIEALKQRLDARNQDNKDIINKRMQASVSEIKHFNEFDYLVVNDNFEDAIEKISSIIYSKRLTLDIQTKKYKNLIKKLLSTQNSI
jgi:guanylate kinase